MIVRARLLAVLLLGIAVPGVRGDAVGARAALAQEVRDHPNDVGALTNYAEFLDRYGDPACRDAYRKMLAAIENSGNSARAGAIARRLTRLDLLAGEREAAWRASEPYPRAPGSRLSVARV